MKQRWIEHRDEMIAICQLGGQVVGKVRPSHSKETKQQISETLKAKGCYPPWELSPCIVKGYKASEMFGEEVAERRRQAIILYNTTRVVSLETRIKMSKAKQGAKNVGWKGGVTVERQRLYNTLEMKNWRRSIFQRDNYICQECESQQQLNAHHIKQVAGYPELQFDIDNGKTLCLECHKKTDTYGGKWAR